MVTEVQLKMVPRPFWGRAKQVYDLFGVTEKILRRLVAQGHVRTRKLGDSQNAIRIFSVTDLWQYLEYFGEIEGKGVDDVDRPDTTPGVKKTPGSTTGAQERVHGG